MAEKTQEVDLVHSLDEIADAIVKVSELGEKLFASKLNRTALVVLLQHAIGQMRRDDIERVLDALPKMKDLYLSAVKDKRK